MAGSAIPAVNHDFSSVMNFLASRGAVAVSPSPELIGYAKRIHRATYSLILWRFRLKKLPEHGKTFIEEIASDSLQILPQVLMGYSKTAKLLTRGVIENTLRHIYFSDHPVEYQRMNRVKKWYLGIDPLFDYLRAHPIFVDTEPRFDAINRLTTLYDDLSAGVHGRTVRDLEMRTALSRIAYSNDGAKREAGLVERCAESANFCLAAYHARKMASFSKEDQRIILRTIPSRARRIWLEGL